MPELPTASTVPPVIVSAPSLSSGEPSSPTAADCTSTVPPVIVSVPFESIASPWETSTKSVPP